MIDIQSVTIWFYQKDGQLTFEVRCPACQSKPEVAKEAQDKDHLVYMLNCPKCNAIRR
jgi:ssDNA-binding Zn-finger/Zn-ribbon topoisomerase 1